ncbi:MAG: biotin--[acetyl-CoA-carboxylase] ligase [Planctomycetes bacterium]|nr:biotin--[acetyl-CoA-carboxylase] ligase [Planctomycetota bacterium]
MFDIPRIIAETPIKRIEHHVELPSTNDFALEHLRAGGARDLPLLVLAERQTRGRGRGERSWWSSDGALTFSVAVAWNELRLPISRRPMLSLIAGLAVCDAIGELLAGAPIRLKWPNDVYLNGRKVCGILIESPAYPADVVVVGIGVNVNNSFHTAPPEIRQQAVSMLEFSTSPYELSEVLICILRSLDKRLHQFVAQPEAIVSRWRSLCFLTGRQITLNTGSRRIFGRCEGIDELGRLILRTSEKEERFASGTIDEA